METKDYSPQDLFAGDAIAEQSPRVVIGPHRYIQGEGVLDQLGRYLSVLNSRKTALLITRGGMKRVGDRVLQSLNKCVNETVNLFFDGECSDKEVERLLGQLKNNPIDSLIAVGGGKCIDTAKCVAHCMSVPVVVCPTLASTDAPCSAVSVMYTPEGVFERPWFFPESPAMVIVDTGVIVRSPLRHLVSGMGDAMSTYYEARTCFLNPKARTMVGARPTVMAFTISELGAKLLFENGLGAVEAVKKLVVNEALENVIEANTLLSGVGFESGGLAASHGVAQVFPVIPFLHEKYLHGEMVALGVLTHRCLEGDIPEAKRIAEFFAKIGLPVHFGQLSLDPEGHEKEMDLIIDEALKVPFMQYEPFEITAGRLKETILEAHAIGVEVARNVGDSAYRELHPEP